MATSKRNKTNVEKRYISRLWLLRSRYNAYKADFEDIGNYQDGVMMRKAEKEISQLRMALSRVAV